MSTPGEDFDKVAHKGKEPVKVLVPVVKVPLPSIRKWLARVFGGKA